jgi:hypothetical protein
LRRKFRNKKPQSCRNGGGRKVTRNAFFLVGAILFVVLSLSNAEAIPIDVFQGGSFIGTINPYTGSTSSTDNWNKNTYPDIGPTGTSKTGKIFFYDSMIDGLNFNMLFHRTGMPRYGSASWDVIIYGSPIDPYVKLSDDANELQEVGDNVFQGRWSWGMNADGGIIGPLGGSNWAVTIDPVSYSKLDNLYVYDASGSYFALNLNTDTTGTIVLTPTSVPVPEPTTILLIGTGLVGFLGLRKKFKK